MDRDVKVGQVFERDDFSIRIVKIDQCLTAPEFYLVTADIMEDAKVLFAHMFFSEGFPTKGHIKNYIAKEVPHALENFRRYLPGV